MAILHNLGGGSLADKNILTQSILSSEPMNAAPGAGTFAQGVYLGIIFDAVVVGPNGNLIQVVYDGIIDSGTGLTNWNGPNPGNTATMDDTGYIHPVGSLTLTGGTDNVHDFVVDGGETITSDFPGASGVTITGDGVKDWNTLIIEWNALNVGNEVTLTAGNPLNVATAIAHVFAGNGPGVAASGTYDGVTYTADNVGVAGNVTLNFNGTSDSRTSVLAAWNLGNPTNTLAITAEVITPLAGTATLAGGSIPSSGITTPATDTEDSVSISLDVSWTGGTAIAGTMSVEVSNGGIVWTPLTGISGIKIAADSGNDFLDVSYVNFKLWRFVYTATGGTDGFMTVVLNVRGQ